jgi:hypothetical protein
MHYFTQVAGTENGQIAQLPRAGKGYSNHFLSRFVDPIGKIFLLWVNCGEFGGPKASNGQSKFTCHPDERCGPTVKTCSEKCDLNAIKGYRNRV